LQEASFVVNADESADALKGLGDMHSQFKVTSELSVFHHNMSKSFNATQKSQDVLLDVEGFKVLLAHGKQEVKDALGRGVRVRVIVEEPENPQTAGDMFGFEHPLLTVKYVSAPVTICMMLFDDREVHLRLYKDNVPSFWSSNVHIINLSKTYFNEIWNKL
jgi:hypothetical protein